MYYFSASTRCFYPDELLPGYRNNHSLPEDLIEISSDEFLEYSGVPPEGMQRGVGESGRPSWVDIPPPTKDQLVAQATAEKGLRSMTAEEIIAPLSRAVKYGMATPDEKTLLECWEKYSVQLSRVNPGDAPDIVWPVAPETVQIGDL